MNVDGGISGQSIGSSVGSGIGDDVIGSSGYGVSGNDSITCQKTSSVKKYADLF